MRKSHRRANWLGNVTWEAARVAEPSSSAAVARVVVEAARDGHKVRAMGAGHSWSPLCVTDGVTLSLRHLNRIVAVDHERLRVTVEAGILLKDLVVRLDEEGLALVNLGAILEQSVAGAISTATHGSGLGFGHMATQVVGMRLVTGRGDTLTISETENAHLLDAARVSLGALGIITEVTLQVTRAYNLREVREPLPFDEVVHKLPDLVRSADHFKLWWFPQVPVVQIYRQHRTQESSTPKPRGLVLSEDSRAVSELFGALLRLGNAVPALIPGIQRAFVGGQFKPLDRIGKSYEIFTLAMPPMHHEAEYAIPLGRASEAILGLRALIQRRRHPAHFISEVRFVGGDASWLSPAYGGDVCYIGGYESSDARWPSYLRDYEELMLSLGGRPHWGKEFTVDGRVLRERYPRWDDFVKLRDELDPDRIFDNALVRRLFGA